METKLANEEEEEVEEDLVGYATIIICAYLDEQLRRVSFFSKKKLVGDFFFRFVRMFVGNVPHKYFDRCVFQV